MNRSTVTSILGGGLVGWVCLLYAFGAVGFPAMPAWFLAAAGMVAVGFPFLRRAWTATVVATAGVLVVVAWFGMLHLLAQDHARDYLADNPPAATSTTTATWVAIPAAQEETP